MRMIAVFHGSSHHQQQTHVGERNYLFMNIVINYHDVNFH